MKELKHIKKKLEKEWNLKEDKFEGNIRKEEDEIKHLQRALKMQNKSCRVTVLKLKSMKRAKFIKIQSKTPEI